MSKVDCLLRHYEQGYVSLVILNNWIQDYDDDPIYVARHVVEVWGLAQLVMFICGAISSVLLLSITLGLILGGVVEHLVLFSILSVVGFATVPYVNWSTRSTLQQKVLYVERFYNLHQTVQKYFCMYGIQDMETLTAVQLTNQARQILINETKKIQCCTDPEEIRCMQERLKDMHACFVASGMYDPMRDETLITRS